MEGKRTFILFFIICTALAVLFCLDILFGSVSLGFSDIWAVLRGKTSGTSMDPAIVRSIVLDFRLPKAIVAVVAGASLAASGLQMQTLFRNPLAGPYVLGISSGASLGAAIVMLGLPLLGITGMGETLRSIGSVGAAWIGAAGVLLIVMAVSVRIKDIMVILILGMMFGSAAGALVEILQFLSPEGRLKTFVLWTMGSLGDVTLRELWILVPVCIGGLLLSVMLIKPLNMLLLGENYARTMGLSIKSTRTMIFASTTILAGTVTAFCGPIGFLGIAVPHIARMMFAEADHRVLMPASILLGAALMLLCDMISQLPGFEMTLPVNTVTALLGIPIVMIVIFRNRRIF